MDNNEVNIEKLIISNAKAIQALSEALTADREERKKAEQRWEKERSQLYQYLGRIASAQSNFYEVQSDYYHQLALLSERQVNVEEKLTEMQSQILEILAKLSSQD
jgi:hypothetical protein